VAVLFRKVYKGSGGFFLLFLTTALHGASNKLGNYWIRAEWASRMVLAFLVIWSAVQPTAHSLSFQTA